MLGVSGLPGVSGVLGVGIDAVDIERFRATLRRTPSMRRRLFTTGELAYADEVTCRPIAGATTENIYVEADGELLGRLPITLSIAPDALTVLVPKGHPSLLG